MRKLYKLKRRVKDLTSLRDSQTIRLQALDLLTQHQGIVGSVLLEYNSTSIAQAATTAASPSTPPACSSNNSGSSSICGPSVVAAAGDEEMTCCQWPLLDWLASMRLADYEFIKSLTSEQLAAILLQHHQQLAGLVGATGEQEQEQQQDNHDAAQVDETSSAALYAAAGNLSNLFKALNLLTPNLAYSLRFVNLLTGRLDPPGPEHWQQAMAAADLSDHQVRLIREVLHIVKEQLRQLEAERRELATLIDVMKVLSVNSMGEVDASGLEAMAGQGGQTVAVSATPACSTQSQGPQQEQHRHHHHHQQQQQQQEQAQHQQQQQACSTSSSAGACDDIRMPLLCKDMVTQLGSKVERWRTLHLARTAVMHVFRADQLMQAFLACFPFMPLTDAMCDHLPGGESCSTSSQLLNQC